MTTTETKTGQTWNPTAYATHGRFVADMATAVVALLNPQPKEHILDVGCGDGALTEQLAATGAILTGADASAAMVEAAQTRAQKSCSPFEVAHHPAENLPYENQFDAAFSNAALHWIPEKNQPAALAAIHRALKPKARFVAEMGGFANIAAIRAALQSTLAPHGIDAEAEAASFYPTPATYSRLLEAAGFSVQSIELIYRSTPFKDGMEVWLNTFRNGVLDRLDPIARTQVLHNTVALLKTILRDHDGNWIADYVRLRFHATRA